MEVLLVVAAVGVAYLLGSLPFGVLVGRLWGVNPLETGSGRMGATNVFRAGGPVPALLTGALDVAKGFLAVWLAGQVAGTPLAQVLAGVAVVLGHCFSIFVGYRGGAGVATSLGALGAIYLPAALAMLVLLLLVIAITRYASVGSLTVTTLVPLVLLVLGLAGTLPLVFVLYGMLLWIIIVYAHRPNIARLLAGSERRLGESRERG
jgi:glycerol-3-phosphate acyltransferase PlsY